MPIIRTTEGHGKIPSEDTLFDSGDEDRQLSAWHRMMAHAGYMPILLWPMIEWPALEMHSIVVAPGLAKSLSRVLDLWDNLRLTYTLISTNSENRIEQHLTICHQPSHGYHIYLTSIDWLLSLYWLLDLTQTYFNSLSDPFWSPFLSSVIAPWSVCLSCQLGCLILWERSGSIWSNMPIIRTTEGHEKIPPEDTLFDSGDEGGQLSA